MSMSENTVYRHLHLTSTGVVSKQAGVAGSVLCSTSSSGTLTLYDNTTNSGPILCNAMPLVAGQYYPLNKILSKGLYAVIGGTADISINYT